MTEQSLKYKRIEMLLDKDIALFEKLFNVTIPKENSKNAYLKCCWMLAKYNKMLQHKNLDDETMLKLREAQKDYKDTMPFLKKCIDDGLITA